MKNSMDSVKKKEKGISEMISVLNLKKNGLIKKMNTKAAEEKKENRLRK
jgi:hypothetical protein